MALTDEQVSEIFNQAQAQYKSGVDEFATPENQRQREGLGGESMIGRIFDVLSRGEYASASIAEDYILGKPFDAGSFVAGLKGERKTTYDSLVEKTFPDAGKWEKMGLSFGLAIFADPTTYLPLGLVGKALGKGTEAIGKTKVGKIIGESKIAKAFKPSAGLPEDYYELKYYSKKALEAKQQEIIKDVEFLRSGLSKDDMELLSFLREHPNEAIPEKLVGKLEMLSTRFDALLDDAVKNGVITENTATLWKAKEVPYVPHYYPEQGYRLARGEIPPSLFEKAKKPSFLKQRKFETFEDAKGLASDFDDISKSSTIQEARNKISQYGLEDAFGKVPIEDLEMLKGYAESMAKHYTPDENIIRAYALRASEQAGYIARQKYVDDVLENFGTKIAYDTKVIPEGYGKYLPKGAIRFYAKEVIDAKFADELRGLADELKDLRIKTESVSTTKTTTETTMGGVAPLAESGPMVRLESVVRESLMNRGMTEGEANAYIGRLKANGSVAVDDIVKETSEKTDTIRTVLESKQFENELVNLALLTDEQKKVMVGITKKVPTYMLPEAIAKDMNKFNSFFIGDPTTNELLKIFDKAQNVWKMMATTIRLPFHLRNMYSNWWQAYLSGINPSKLPDRLIEAAMVQSGKIKKITLHGKEYTYQEIKSQIDQLGIHGKGWLGADIPKAFFDEVESIVKYGKLRHLNPLDAGRQFGMLIEDNARIAVFLNQIDNGKSFKEASQAVRKYMFDYSELTDFEKNVMRRAWPFYTWSRKNIPLQIHGLLNQPRKYQIYGKGMRAFEQPETSQEERLKPKYFEEMLYVKSPFKTEKGKPIYMSLDLPPLEFNRMTSIRHWLSGLSPAKIVAEVGLNFKTFPELQTIGEPLEKTRAPFWAAWLPEKIIDTFSKPIKIGGAIVSEPVFGMIMDMKTGKKILGMDKHWAHALQSAFPFLNELNRIHAQPIVMDDESPEMKWKSYLTGISRSALDKKLQMEREAWGIMRTQKKMNKFTMQHFKAPTEDEMKILDPDEYMSGFYKPRPKRKDKPPLDTFYEAD